MQHSTLKIYTHIHISFHAVSKNVQSSWKIGRILILRKVLLLEEGRCHLERQQQTYVDNELESSIVVSHNMEIMSFLGFCISFPNEWIFYIHLEIAKVVGLIHLWMIDD
jgi:hypothetical protein